MFHSLKIFYECDLASDFNTTLLLRIGNFKISCITNHDHISVISMSEQVRVTSLPQSDNSRTDGFFCSLKNCNIWERERHIRPKRWETEGDYPLHQSTTATLKKLQPKLTSPSLHFNNMNTHLANTGPQLQSPPPSALWNSFPQDLCDSESITVFQSRLQTDLFSSVYSQPPPAPNQSMPVDHLCLPSFLWTPPSPTLPYIVKRYTNIYIICINCPTVKQSSHVPLKSANNLDLYSLFGKKDVVCWWLWKLGCFWGIPREPKSMDCIQATPSRRQCHVKLHLKDTIIHTHYTEQDTEVKTSTNLIVLLFQGICQG